MPKSKRNRIVSLTKTKRKGHENKEILINAIRECVDSYKYLYVFSVQNMRSNKVKEIRSQFHDSRFFMGKNKVMQIALGRSVEDEIKKDLHLISKNIIGNCGIMFTNQSKEEVVKFFSTFVEKDYARAGYEVTETICLNEGPLPQFSHAIEPYIRKLGMPTVLKVGVVTLTRDYVLCKVGDILTPEQARLLKLLEMKISEFRITMRCCWSAKEESYEGREEEIGDNNENEKDEDNDESEDDDDMQT